MSDQPKTQNYELMVIALNGICEDAMGDLRDEPATSIDSLFAYESMGMVVPPFLRAAVMEFVMRNSSLHDYCRGRSSVVYFIRDASAGTVKIGCTTASKARISQMQCHNSGALEIMATIDGTREDEKALHTQWKHLKIRGEWFRLTDELSEFIAGLAGKEASN